ncbi:hypothetical protein U8C35_06345 [Sinorhizobium medicae]|uniref:hypothetical protein n=1 Tax=Sinorhizobium medicae TaxID=110321 RepID=UPI002AF6BEB0|nr:hypothetical protein [Sinorhizobium medicae]WQO60052.1 hypothetical protein U8C35_06345 [Sinorhizobium medicae]
MVAFFIIDSVEKRKAAANYVARIASKPLMSVEIKPYKKNRSQAQNRLYRMWLGIIAETTGEDDDDLHEQLKARILGFESKIILGEAVRMPKSTTKITVDEFSHYLNAVEHLATELNITLPMPDDAAYALGR